jgi:hypothetical protein
MNRFVVHCPTLGLKFYYSAVFPHSFSIVDEDKRGCLLDIEVYPVTSWD